ncbi:MAG: Abi family protein [Tissierellia bacterium]|nr:Abi family protein [Tissierellia bacterium]
MKKYFKTLDEQVELLKSRNLIIENEAKAKDVLLNYNFYKVINGTRKYFVDAKGSYRYRDMTSFRDLEVLHEFDKEIKKFFLTSILDIERHLRSVISYVFMKFHPEAESYLNPKNFNSDTSLISANTYTLTKTIETYREEDNYNKSIKYYSDKYDHVPFWFLVNFISFGKLVNFYQTMKEKEAYEVANSFSRFLIENAENAQGYYISTGQFESFIIALKDIRNVVAHDNLLLGYRAEEDLDMIGPVFKPWGIGNEDSRDYVFNIYLIMQVFLTRQQFRELTYNLQASIEKLKKEIDEKAFSMVMKDLGFPEDF